MIHISVSLLLLLVILGILIGMLGVSLLAAHIVNSKW